MIMRDYKNVTVQTELSAADYIGAAGFILTIFVLLFI
jgi:hypothetical protein